MEPTPEMRQEIEGTDTAPENEIAWQPAEGLLPMKYVSRGESRVAAVVAGLIGITWSLIIAKALLASLKGGAPVADILFLVLVGIPGILGILYTISQFVSRHEIAIYPDRVTETKTSLKGRQQWSEPVSAYTGVLKQFRYDFGPEQSASRTVYTIKLSPTDRNKDIILYRISSRRSYPPALWEKRWRQYAELFRLPLMEETAEGVTAKKPDEESIPIREKVRHGRVQTGRIDPAMANLGWLAKLERDGDVWVIMIQEAWAVWHTALGIAVWFLMWGGLFYLLFYMTNPELLTPVVLITSAILLIIVILAWRSFRSKLAHSAQLRIDTETISYRYWLKPHGWRTRRISLSRITDIAARTSPSCMKDELVIEGRGETIRFGQELPAKTKPKLKECLLSMIGESPKEW